MKARAAKLVLGFGILILLLLISGPLRAQVADAAGSHRNGRSVWRRPIVRIA